MRQRILIAGIGNIFFGDDGFGVEVARQLSKRQLPHGVSVIDFGIRTYDLAYALTDGYNAVVLVDVVSRGELPGTVFVIEPELNPQSNFEGAFPDGHSLNPASILQLARSFGKVSEKLFLVGCEPAVLERDDGEIGLSEAAYEAIPRAIAAIDSIISDLSASNPKAIPTSRLVDSALKGEL